MSRDREPCWGTNTSVSGLSDFFYLGSLGRVINASVPSRTLTRFRKELSHLLSTVFRRKNRSVRHVHTEAVFRFLLAHEVKRSGQSDRSIDVLLVYLASPEETVICMDDRVTRSLLPALSAVLRETDHIGWYRDHHIIGGVLTALVSCSTREEIAGRIEERLIRRLRESVSVQDISRLRLRFLQSHELETFDSTDRIVKLD